MIAMIGDCDFFHSQFSSVLDDFFYSSRTIRKDTVYVVVGERIVYDHRILWKRFKGWIGRVVVILDYKSIRIFYE